MEQLRRLAVSMVLDGESVDEVARVLQVSERSVWQWLGAWRKGGEAALMTRPGWGRPPKIQAAQIEQVLGWLNRSPLEFGFITERWTAPRLAAVVEERLGIQMNHRYLNDWLRHHGITPQIPHRRPRERNESVITAWIARQWPLIKKK